MTHKIISFLKFGSEKNITDLYSVGTIYMNTIEYFRKYEDEELRGDKYEGASWVKNSLPGTFLIPGSDQIFNYQKVHIRQAYEEVLGNIYSLYSISSHGIPNFLEFKMDERLVRFGTHCLMIKDNQYFLDQMRKQLTANSHEFHEGFVNYYDKEKANKQLTLFEKPLEFEYQKEFRFYVKSDNLQPIKINIGSLEQYSQMYRTEDLLQLKLINNKNESIS
jgi:hypothetical protein